MVVLHPDLTVSEQVLSTSRVTHKLSSTRMSSHPPNLPIYDATTQDASLLPLGPGRPCDPMLKVSAQQCASTAASGSDVMSLDADMLEQDPPIEELGLEM